jgi:hypothetical protein
MTAGGQEDVVATAGEPAVHAGPGDAGLYGDALDRDGSDAVVGDAGEGGVGDPLRSRAQVSAFTRRDGPHHDETVRPFLSQGKGQACDKGLIDI